MPNAASYLAMELPDMLLDFRQLGRGDDGVAG
jgi:hypothetical protein